MGTLFGAKSSKLFQFRGPGVPQVPVELLGLKGSGGSAGAQRDKAEHLGDTLCAGHPTHIVSFHHQSTHHQWILQCRC